MPRIVPSQVVAFIKSSLPEATHRADENGNFFINTPDQGAKLRALVRMVEFVPIQLLPDDSKDYEDVLFATSAIEYQLKRWESGDVKASLGLCDGKSRHPVTLLYNALKKCKDEAPTASTSELGFVTDPTLRESIRLDIGGAVSALANNEFKAATVLAGAAIEAMLLWAIQAQDATKVDQARKDVITEGGSGCASPQPQDWVLTGYIAVARKLGLLCEHTSTTAGLTKDFRNLIHPGAAQRTKQQCGVGNARVAVGAIDIVADDLQRALAE